MKKKQRPIETKYRVRRLVLFLAVSVFIVAIGWATTKFVMNMAKNKAQNAVNIQALDTAPVSKGAMQGPPMLGKSERQALLATEEPKKVYDWNLVLINERNPLPEDFSVELERIHEGLFLDARIAAEFKQMIAKAKEDGISIECTNAFIDPMEQEELFNAEVAKLLKEGISPEEAEKKVAQTQSPPWLSEHHTGLAVDLSSPVQEEEFSKSAASKWLSENATEYGFILRYPEGKQIFTDKEMRADHYRYVGKYAAEIMKENGYCLEEYLSIQELLEGKVSSEEDEPSLIEEASEDGESSEDATSAIKE